MQLPRESREYAHWPITGAPDDAVFEISFITGTWLPMETTDTGARILVAGPDAEPGDAHVLAVGYHRPDIRVVDNPEIPVRPWPPGRGRFRHARTLNWAHDRWPPSE